MRALNKKLLRDLGAMRGQALTIALVVAAGIAAFVAFQTTYRSLVASKDAFYGSARFGDLFVRLERAPRSVLDDVRALPGVARAHGHLAEPVLVPLPDLPEPAVAELVSLPDVGRPPLDDVVLSQGRLPEPGSPDEVLLLTSFAEARKVALRDRLPVVLDGRLRQLLVVGLGVSPTYVFPIGGGSITSDPERFAVLWMREGVIAPAFRMDGAFGAVSVTLQPGASPAAVKAALDRALEPYGGAGAYDRSDQPSNAALEGELFQLRTWATIVPVIFLGVAAFLLNVVLSRLVYLQRAEIATLKAVGYSNWQVGLHYLTMVTVLVLAGACLGGVLGAWLGQALTDLYLQFFRFPKLLYTVPPDVVLTGTAVSLVAAAAGALGSARRVARLPPAEAMRPAAPTTFRPTLLERLGVHRLLTPSGRIVLRELGRRPLRLALSTLGIAMALAILVVGRFSVDALEYVMDVQFRRAWREDVSVAFARPKRGRALSSLSHAAGVGAVEGQRVVGARIAFGSRHRDVAIIGYADTPALRRPLDIQGRQARLSSQGVVLTAHLARRLGLEVGDEVLVELKEGKRPARRVQVTGLVDEPFGMLGHMRLEALNRLLDEPPDVVSTALLRVDPRAVEALIEELAELPEVISVTRRAGIIERFDRQTKEMMLSTTLIMTLFAVVIAVGVVYNNARIALSMRSRELASLRVLGFHRSEISAILLGELGVQVTLSLPLGLLIGKWMAVGVMLTVDADQYRIPAVIAPETYAFAAVVTVVVGALSALLVRRKLDHLDLVAVLKERE